MAATAKTAAVMDGLLKLAERLEVLRGDIATGERPTR
jgi:hypothetical protein